MHHRGDRGFTIIEIMMVVAVMGIIYAMAVPGILAGLNAMKLNAAAQQVHAELQSARLKAVATDRPMRIRFDCPAAGQLRVVELIGSTAFPDPQDSAPDRCSPVTYPYPAKDTNRITRPNFDGPPRFLPKGVVFTASQTIEFWPNGTAHVSGGPPWPAIVGDVSITVYYKSKSKTIKVNGLGKVQTQP